MPKNNNIWDEIQNERQRQDKQWGGAEHDDLHLMSDWFRYIQRQMFGVDTCYPTQLRYKLIKIAALAVAAIESCDRKHGYDS